MDDRLLLQHPPPTPLPSSRDGVGFELESRGRSADGRAIILHLQPVRRSRSLASARTRATPHYICTLPPLLLQLPPEDLLSEES